MSQRFFVETPIETDYAELFDSEAHHLAHVMRANPGDVVTLFDGSGAEFQAKVTDISRSRVRLNILSRSEVDRELPFALTLGVALPKGERQRWLMEKVVELGVTRVVPLITRRGVAQLGEASIRRLRRAVVEASKQCGRNRLLEIDAPRDAMDYFQRGNSACARLIAHQGGRKMRLVGSERAASVMLAVGPEGGFTTDEIERAESLGWQTVDLGPRILRVETAAITFVLLTDYCHGAFTSTLESQP
jgi:16S rRNA (uracil1498-N3)-methyltransferase